MSRALRSLRLTMAGMAVIATAAAAVPANAQAEINYLITTVATSNCEFNRNGQWFDAKQASAHLRDKYHSPFARPFIGSAEDFIARIASRSSVTGREYAIRCVGQPAEPSAQWLWQRLAAYRLASGTITRPP